MNLSIFQGNFLFNLKHIVNKYIANCACAINHSTITCLFQCFMGLVLKQNYTMDIVLVMIII